MISSKDANDWRREIRFEAWVVAALRHQGHAERDLFCGTTTREIRIERLRKLILERQLGERYAGKIGGAPKVWREIFEHLYGEPLVPCETSKEAA